MKENIIHRDRLEKYLIVFNELKFKYTGIESRCSIRNKKITQAWEKAVNGMSDSDIDSMAKDIVKAIYAACHSEWHKENKFKWITPEIFLRADKLEYWTNDYISNHHVNIAKPFVKNRYV